MFFMVSHKYKFLLGWSAKCGCSSVKKWYLATHNINAAELNMPVYKAIGYGNTEYSRVEWSNPQKYKEYRKFVVVRNPYSRAVSGFVNKYVIEKAFPNRGWSTYDEFLHILSKDKKFETVDTHHFTPQFSENFPRFKRAGFTFDHVIKLEELTEELQRIGTLLGTDPKVVPKANETKYGSQKESFMDAANMKIADFDLKNIPPYQSFYDESRIKLIHKIYAMDFENLARLNIFYDSPLNTRYRTSPFRFVKNMYNRYSDA